MITDERNLVNMKTNTEGEALARTDRRAANGRVGRKGRFGLILAFILLINPSINVFDLLPDFIAYIIIANRLDYAKDKSPFFFEARDALRKLALVSLIKLPAFFLMITFRSHNVGDNDIRALFAVSFAVIEAVLLYSLVKNLFSAFFYLGQRSENSGLIRPFRVGKSKRTLRPEMLSVLTYVFVFYKCLISFLPETFLLTRIVTESEAKRTFNLAPLYPYTVLFGAVTLIAFGIIITRYFLAYIRAFGGRGGFISALDSMVSEEKRIEIDTSRRVDAMKYALTLLAAASVLTLELRFDNLNGINLLPPFVFGFVVLFAAIRLSRYTGRRVPSAVFGTLFILFAILRYLLEFYFYERFGLQLLPIDSLSRIVYLVLLGAFLLETVFFICLALSVMKLLLLFVKKHTLIEETDERYSRQDRIYHTLLRRKVYIYSGLSVLVWLSKLFESLFKFFSKNIFVSWETSGGDLSVSRPSTGMVTESIIPWFGLVVLLLSIIFIVYSFTFMSTLKEDAEMKYLDD